jgi:chromosome partitioning protein
MSRKIAILSQKGGVGKTSVVLNLAYALSRIGGKKVLAVDVDPQGGIATALNLKPEKGLVQILRGESTLKEALVELKTEALFLLGNGVQAPDDMLYLEEQALAGKLRSILAVYGDYDFVLFDSPAGIGIINREILAISNSFIQVIDCRAGSVKSMAKLLKLSSWIKREVNPGLYLEGVLVNRFQSDNQIQAKILERVKSRFPARLFFETMLKDDIVFEYAAIKGLPVERFADGKKTAKSFLALAIEVCNRKMRLQEDINTLAEEALADDVGDLGPVVGKEGDPALDKKILPDDRITAILRDLCKNGGCRGAVVADEMGLPLAEHQCPFGVDSLSTYGSILGEALVSAGNILKISEANNIAMDINEDEKLVLHRFPLLGNNYFLLSICLQEAEVLGEMSYAADRIAAELR